MQIRDNSGQLVFDEPGRGRSIHGKNQHSNRREWIKGAGVPYSKVSHLQMDSVQKATTAIAKMSKVGCVESLNVAGRHSRSTADASPGRILGPLK